MSKYLLFTFLFICLGTTRANEWVSIKPQVGIGYSDNVYQDDLNKKADYFFWLQTQAKYSLTDSKLIAKATLNAFATEEFNNSLTYSLYRKSEIDIGHLGLSLGLGGFSYLKSQVASTDESFNNFYFIGSITKSLISRDKFELNAEPGMKMTSYPQLSSRNDVNFFAKLDALWNFSSDREINPYFEIGFITSNQSYYSKNYLDLGLLWTERLSEIYKFNVDFSVRNSSYPNRRVSDILFIPNRNGRNTSVRLDSAENISLVLFSAAILRSEQSREYSLGFNYSTENSLSRLEYYTELQILASVLWTF